MADKTNTEERLKKAIGLKESLEKRLEKLKGTPREEEFKIQLEKVDDLIKHLEKELEE
jgi:phage protein U